MIVLYIIIFYLFFIIPSYGFYSFYVYVKNTTPEVLRLPNGAQVQPNEQGIFDSFPVSKVHSLQQKISVKGQIYVENRPEKNCSVNFKTYTNLDSHFIDNYGEVKSRRFLTFILVSEKKGHLTCNPIAAEVYPYGNTMMDKGKKVTIKHAKKAHIKSQKTILELKKEKKQKKAS